MIKSTCTFIVGILCTCSYLVQRESISMIESENDENNTDVEKISFNPSLTSTVIGSSNIKHENQKESEATLTSSQEIVFFPKKEEEDPEGLKTTMKEEDEIRRIFKPPVQSSVMISLAEWHLIKTKEAKEGFTVPQEDWSNFFARKIAKVYPTCAITFLYHNFKKENSRKKKSPVFTAKAKCKQRGCTDFQLKLYRVPENDSPAELLISRTGPIAHPVGDFKKRHIRGSSRKLYAKSLKHHKPSVLHHNLLAKVPETEIDAGNLSTPQTQDVLKKVSSEARRAEDLHRDPLLELIVERNLYKEEDEISQNIQGYIQLLQIYPFCLHLYMESQVDLCVEKLSEKRCVLHLDSTGSLVANINQEKTKKIFYYALVLEDCSRKISVPVGEMITNNHTIPSVTSFLMNIRHAFLTRKAKLVNPRRIETDFSYTLMQAVVQTFNSENLASYIVHTWNIINCHYTEKQLEKVTVLHLCGAHIIKNVRNSLGNICGKDKGMADFSTYVFTLMQTSSNLQEISVIYNSFHKVFTSKKMNATVSKHIESLQRRIAKLSDDSDDEEAKELQLCTTPEEENSKSLQLDIWSHKGSTLKSTSPFYKHFADIEEADTSSDSDCFDKDLNKYYAPEVFKHIRDNYMHLIPLWSGLLLDSLSRYASDSICPSVKPVETKATNSNVESWFRIVKHDILQGRKKLRVGEFVRRMHVCLKGRIRSFKYNLKTVFQKRPSQDNNKKKHLDLSEEKWAKRVKTTGRKAKYFSPPKKFPEPRAKKAHKKESALDISRVTVHKNQGLQNLENNCWINSSIQALQAVGIHLGLKDSKFLNMASILICFKQKS